MSNISSPSNLRSGFLVSVLAVIGFLFGAGATTVIGSFTQETTTLAALGSGAVVGGVIVIATVLINWSLPVTKSDWYVPVSWSLIGLTLGTMVALFVADGIETTVGFLMTYMALSWIPLFVGFYVGTEALSALGITSWITLLVFLIVLAIKLTVK